MKFCEKYNDKIYTVIAVFALQRKFYCYIQILLVGKSIQKLTDFTSSIHK